MSTASRRTRTVFRRTAVLAAIAAVAATAAPARADDPYAAFYSSQDSTQTTRWCTASWQYGVQGEYGAWGKFIDGCTAYVQCPWAHCAVRQATARLDNSASSRTTCNMTIREYTSYWGLRYRADYSSGGSTSCWQARTAPDVGYGDWVTVQSNGVIASGYGRDTSYVWLGPI
jgi:hypothetical protein